MLVQKVLPCIKRNENAAIKSCTRTCIEKSYEKMRSLFATPALLVLFLSQSRSALEIQPLTHLAWVVGIDCSLSFLHIADIWATDLDFILNHLEDKRMPMLSFLNTINENERRLLNVDYPAKNFAAIVGSGEYLPRRSYTTQSPTHHVNRHQLEHEVGRLSYEFINLAFSLFVLTARYPSVFWLVSKPFALLFSFQMIINMIQSLIAFVALQVSYKLSTYGSSKILIRQKDPLLLNGYQIILVTLAYIVMLAMSNNVLYFFGLHKYRNWRHDQSKRKYISNKEHFYGYKSHFFAFIVLLMMTAFAAPLIYNLTIIYCGSLDGTILVALLSTILHLFSWVILWFALTLKSKWKFVANDDGHAANARDSRSNQRGDVPLLVIERGKTYQIREETSKRAILGMVQQNARSQKMSPGSDDKEIYWLKPKPPTPTKDSSSPDDEQSLIWLKAKKSTSKNKLSSHEDGQSTTGSAKGKKKATTKSPKNTVKKKGKEVDFEHLADQSDGDYATLIQMVNNANQGNISHQVSACKHVKQQRLPVWLMSWAIVHTN